MTVRIKLLGIPHIRVGSELVKLPNRRVTLALLAFLLLRRGELLARSHVAFAIWPDEEEERALSELRRHLYKLRRLFDEEHASEPFFAVDDDTIGWNTRSAYELDLEEFERRADDPARLDEAIALYEGDLLEEIYDDWILAERERLRSRYLAALAASIASARSRRAYPQALAAAQRLLAADPWREDAVRQAMAIRYESGDAAGALAAYERFARELRAEMSVDPMPETQTLRETISRGAPLPAANARGAGVLDEPVSVGRPIELALPFVGRERELAFVRAQWDRAAAGAGTFTLIEGEAGIGKSRLTAELAMTVEAQGARVLAGATTSPEHRPYQALVDALRGALPLLAALDLPAPSLAALADLIPELRARRPGLPELDRLDPASERTRFFDALARAFTALAKPRPVLLVLEDLHWAGSVTIDALAFLVPRIAASSIAIVGTLREDEASRAHPLRSLERSLRGTALASRLALGPLDRSAADSLVAALVADPALREEIAGAAFERSEGNALFLTEMLRDAAEGRFARDDVPQSIRTMIVERAAQLSPRARAFADVAAVVGGAFDVDLVCEVSGTTLRDAEAALDELLERHVVRELARRNRNDFAFAHQLVHATLYESVEPTARERRHRRVARALAHAPGAQAAEIAFHSERGGDPAAAAAAYLAAARNAAELFANVEARAWAERGLALARDDARLRFDLLLAHEEVVTRVGDRAAHLRDLGELTELARTIDGEAICTVLARAIDGAYRSENRAAELTAIEELERQASALGDERYMALAIESRGQRELALANGAGALACALDVRARYDRVGDESGSVRALCLASIACSETGETERAAALAREARERAERSGDARLRMRALRIEGRAAQARQDNGAFREVALATLALARATGDRDAEAHAHYQIGTAAWAVWRIDEAVTHLRAACETLTQLGNLRVASSINNLAGLLIDLGRFDEARAQLARAADAAERAGLEDTANHIACNLAELSWIVGDRERLRDAARDALERASRLSPPRQEAVARVAAARSLRCDGDPTGALAQYDRALAIFEAMLRHADVVDVLGERALTQLAAGDATSARATIERAEAIRREHAGLELQYPSRYSWIVACVARGNGDERGVRAALDVAGGAVERRAAAIGDPDLRAAFRAIPYHRAIAAARERDRWPGFSPCAVAFAAVPADESVALRPDLSSA